MGSVERWYIRRGGDCQREGAVLGVNVWRPIVTNGDGEVSLCVSLVFDVCKWTDTIHRTRDWGRSNHSLVSRDIVEFLCRETGISHSYYPDE